MSIIQLSYAKEIVTKLSLTALHHPTSNAKLQIDTLLQNLVDAGVESNQIEEIRAVTILAQVTTIL
jgi:hypothetical protein